MEGDVEFFTELLQVVGRRLVGDVLHAYVDGLNVETGMGDTGTLRQQLCQQQRVLAAGESHEHSVVVLQQLVGGKGTHEPLVQPFE